MHDEGYEEYYEQQAWEDEQAALDGLSAEAEAQQEYYIDLEMECGTIVHDFMDGKLTEAQAEKEITQTGDAHDLSWWVNRVNDPGGMVGHEDDSEWIPF